jgi:biotin carboxylase
MRKRRILILNAEISSVLPFSWYYKNLGYTVIGGTNALLPTIFLSKSFDYSIYIPSPNSTKKDSVKNFIKKVKKICQKYDITLLLSFYEHTSEPIIKYKRRFKIKKIFPSYKSYRILLDKILLKKYLETKSFQSFSIPRSYKRIIKFPCIIKPNIGVGGKYVRICRNHQELKRYFKIIKLAGKKPLIEEYIPFQDRLSVNLLVDRKFRIKRVVAGEVYKHKLINAIKELEDFFKEIKYFGLANPQFIVKNEELYLTEINPRLGSVPLGIDFGANFPESFHKAILENEDIEEKFVFIPKKNFRYYKLRYLLRMYINKYKDLFPPLIEGCIFLNEWVIKNKIKLLFSKEHKKWLEVFIPSVFQK